VVEHKKRLYLSTPLGWPAEGRITSHFGQRLDPFSHNEEFHFGVDIANIPGTIIRSTADGKVRVASWMSGYGNLVVVDHDFGFSTRYAHNRKFLVKPGDIVKRGQPLAEMGMTGKANGPHCHYEVWQYNKRKNPYKYLDDTVFVNNSKSVKGKKS
jgi:murein DD-endopeptidase MepM/ murein hydrolase activator NlpD